MAYSSATLDEILHALADPTRRSIVDRLTASDLSVGELAGDYAVSLAAVLQHVQVLERSGLVSTFKIGRSRFCRIEPDGLRVLEGWAGRRREAFDRRSEASVILAETLAKAVEAAVSVRKDGRTARARG